VSRFKITSLVFGLFILATKNAMAAGGCSEPSPPQIPDGSTATMEEMIETQTAVKAYQTAMANYRSCLDNYMSSIKDAVREGDSEAGVGYVNANRERNASIDTEEDVADEFNIAIKAYKAANPDA